MESSDVTVAIMASAIVLSGLIINLTRVAPATAQKEHQTLLLFRLLVPFALFMSLLFYITDIGGFPFKRSGSIAGIILFTAGMALRWFAVISLGKAFTVQLAVQSSQELYTGGVYKYIRHPSYTGMLLYYAGLGMVQHNWLSLSVLIILPLFAILIRIQHEESLLIEHFSQKYKDYITRSYRLIPWIY
jgi:protein-S-isoprenylcysteine O-methyltransferase Ste14